MLLISKAYSVKMMISQWRLSKYKKKVIQNPKDASAHARLGNRYAAQKRWIEAIASYHTSMALGSTDKATFLSLIKAYLGFGQTEIAKALLEKNRTRFGSPFTKEADAILLKLKKHKLFPMTNFNHNRYFRLKTIADHINKLYNRPEISVLDIGGGDGALSLFLPDSHYVLAEPTVNGLSIDAFPEKSFDVVVACHVLEHIPVPERNRFLEGLVLRAKDYVILLNPFFQPDGFVEERLKLIIKLTNSAWAKEHLDCTLPNIKDMEDFASSNNYKLRVFPNGSLSTTLAFLFLDHYAALAGRKKELDEINNFYNTFLFDKLNDAQLPTGYLVELSMHSTDIEDAQQAKSRIAAG